MESRADGAPRAAALERRLAEEHERLAMAVAVGGGGVWEFEAGCALFTLDDTGRRLFGLDAEPDGPLRAEIVLSAIHEQDRDRVREALRSAAARDGRYDESFRVLVGGATRWLHSIGRTRGAGANARLIGMSFDTTAEREALAARELLLREMNHRIKNLFAVIGGMIAVCSREADDVRSFAEELGNRIAAMGRAHALTQTASVETPLDLSDLIETVIAPTRTRQAIVIDGPPIRVATRLVTPLALIFHEWATNAAKYGALADPDGALAVNWSRGEAGLTTIEWRETTPGAARAGSGQPGFGTRLIEATVAQLRATLSGSEGDGMLIRTIGLEGLG